MAGHEAKPLQLEIAFAHKQPANQGLPHAFVAVEFITLHWYLSSEASP